MANLTFRNSKIIYYGPHPCTRCEELIAKMGNEWGGSAFSYPSGPIYPNTEWHVHVCDPANVLKVRGEYAASRVRDRFPEARAVRNEDQGWMITYPAKDGSTLTLAGGWPHRGHTLIETEYDAWMLAKANQFPDEAEAS